MDMTEYRASESEKERTLSLMSLMPASGSVALDIGARDGHFSRLLAERFHKVVALDLEKPVFVHPQVECIGGNAEHLPFSDGYIEFSFCAEVLEHIPMPHLKIACNEMQRVTSNRILIGVPYKQDIRLGRTTCSSCGGKNPPWGHVNSFDEARLAELFHDFEVDRIDFVGTTKARTNWISVVLMDFAGNPYGTYDQEEACIHCGGKIGGPMKRNILQLVATKLAFLVQDVVCVFVRPRGNWMHVVFRNARKTPALDGERA